MSLGPWICLSGAISSSADTCITELCKHLKTIGDETSVLCLLCAGADKACSFLDLVLICLCTYFETESHCVTLASLKLTETHLLCCLSAGTNDHHAWLLTHTLRQSQQHHTQPTSVQCSPLGLFKPGWPPYPQECMKCWLEN